MNRSFRNFSAAVVAVAALTASSAETPVYKDASRPVDARVADLLGRMTLEEKVGQLVQGFFHPEWQPPEPQLDAVRKGRFGSFINLQRRDGETNKYEMISREWHDIIQKVAVEESRLGIPIIFGHDIIHGCYTGFPSPLGFACSFEPALFEKAQHFAAREARWAGYDWTFAPMCDVARDPRWGRVVETCGEDPYLVARCVEAQVRGFQGADGECSADDRVPACMKHFAGYSDVIGGRDYNHAECSRWTFRNLHLVPFRAACAAGVETVMSSFNTIDGRPAVDSRWTLTDVLRGEWGFKGFVVSDWAAVEESILWGFAADGAEAARLAVNAGNDMEMCTTNYISNLAAEVKAGRVTMAVLDEAAGRVLRVKFRSGLFEKPYVRPMPEPAELARLADEAHAAAKEAAAKSIVLLKNDGILPLKTDKVALIGPLADDREEMIGSWYGRAEPCRTTLSDELARALHTLGMDGKTCHESRLNIRRGCAVNHVKTARVGEDGREVAGESLREDAIDEAGIREAVARVDVVVLALGEDRHWTGENHSRCTLGLTGRQQELFDFVATLGKPVVAVVCSGRPLVLPRVWDKASAVMYAFQPGCEGPAAIADLLVGRLSPEGRLSMSVARDVGQVPVFYNSYSTGRPGSGRYNDVDRQDAMFPFGFGLGYTTFEYGPTVVDGATARCTVRNTGSRDGVTTAQFYIRDVSCREGVRPVRELRGFTKVALKSGESKTVEFKIDDAALAYTDRDGRLHADPGVYKVVVASDSRSGEMVDFVKAEQDRAE